MSENGEHRDSERADTGSKWVWWSTEESVERGTISVLACAEVALGIWLYWWLIPLWFETNLHLLISVFVAPLLLLRSPASVDAALAAFDRYLSTDEGFRLRSTQGAVVMLLAVGLAALASWGLAETWLSGHDGLSLFWRAGITGWIGLLIGLAVAVAVVGGRALAEAVGEAGAVAVAGIAPGLLLGVWLHSIIIKIGSTIRHLAEGWGRLSVNWRTLVWAHDLRRPPELLPGIERHPELSRFGIRRMLSRYKFESGVERDILVLVGAFSLPIFFLPAWLYRLSLKSTCWFWWPLVFSQTSGRAAPREVAMGENSRADVLFEENSQPWLAKFVAALSLALLLSAIGVPESWLARLSVSRDDIDLLGALGDMIYLMLPCAGVQLALFLLCDRFLARAKAGHLGSWPRTAFLWLFNLRQFLLGSALVAALVLLLEYWVPGFPPFAELVETYYFSWFPILIWT